MTVPNLNALWAQAVAQELVRSGVSHAVICPGSRSTPLALAFASTPGLTPWPVLDERSAAFFALGIAKRSGRPAVCLATSGTAAAHFFPAVIEASMTHIPLVLVSADRPPELQGWGAAQTVPQARLYGEHARFFADLGLPEPRSECLIHLRATVDRAVATALGPVRGPVQLNAPFREPLAPVVEAIPPLSSRAVDGAVDRPLTAISPTRALPDADALSDLARRMGSTDEGVIVCGPRDEDDGLAQALAALSRATGFPLLADATSQARFGPASDVAIAHYDALLRHGPFTRAHRPRVVLRFGGGLTPRSLQAWLDGADAFVAGFPEDGRFVDPQHGAGLMIPGDPVAACEALLEQCTRPPSPWLRRFRDAEQKATRAFDALLADTPFPSEPQLARSLVASLPPEVELFVSSSMPIRDLDAFASASPTTRRVLASRGANGIDGIVSTAAGMAVASGKPTVLFTGDLAFLHDLSGLLLARRHALPLTVVVANNDGGGIFSFLPLAEHPVPFEPLFAMPHGLDLAHAAALAGAELVRPQTLDALRASLVPGGGLRIVELKTERDANVRLHRALFARAAEALGQELA